MLLLFGAIPDESRVARDGDIITGGGVTAGIDFGLVVAAELAGEAFAQTLQLNIEYSPAPPFNSGRPEVASKEALEAARARYSKLLPGRRAGAEAAAARL
jgi:transcriptional regulator GlxA family with amidase domain